MTDGSTIHRPITTRDIATAVADTESDNVVVNSIRMHPDAFHFIVQGFKHNPERSDPGAEAKLWDVPIFTNSNVPPWHVQIIGMDASVERVHCVAEPNACPHCDSCR